MSAGVKRNLQLGEEWLRAGDAAEAERCFRKVLAREPRHPRALQVMGLLAHRRGERDRAVEALEAAAGAAPESAEIHSHLAEVRRAAGDAAGAVQAAREAARLDPGAAPIQNNLGLALQAAERLQEAAEAFRKAADLDPRYPKAHYNLGNLLRRQGRLEEAEASLRRALELQPRYPRAWNALGVVLDEGGRPGEAEAAFRKSLQMAPRDPKAWYNLGNLLASGDRRAEALASYDRALSLHPEYREALLARASVLIRLDRYREAVECLGRANRLAPGDLHTHLLQGQAEFARFDYAAAAAAYRRALEIDPDHAQARGNLELCRAEVCDWEERGESFAGLRELVAAELEAERESPMSPHGALFFPFSPAERLAIVRRRSELVARRAEPVARELGFSHPVAEVAGRLRIGYLSSDFRDNALAHLTAGLYTLHDRERFEVFGYSLGPDDGSDYRRRIAEGCDRFVDLREASDADAARRIHGDGVHLLVDLVGFAGGARPGIPALRPAPIQAIWLYPGSMGGVFHDYLIGDPVATPAETREEYGERLVLLPGTFQVTDRRQPVPEAPPSRTAAGLPEEGVVFCSFNTHAKIEPEVFGAWMRVLAALPASVLWLLEMSREGRRNLRREAEARGVDPGRLVFASHVPRKDHLARLTLADLALDTRVCSGHTTTSDALWAGVPVITCPGETFPSRVSASLLHAVGHPELVAGDLAEYEELALRLARSPGELTELRENLRSGRLERPLFDTPRFVCHLERAYTEMWERRCERGRGPIAPPELDP